MPPTEITAQRSLSGAFLLHFVKTYFTGKGPSPPLLLHGKYNKVGRMWINGYGTARSSLLRT